VNKLLVKSMLLFLMSLYQVKLNAQSTDEEFFNEQLEETKQLIVMLKVDMPEATVIGSGIIVGRENKGVLILTAWHVLHKGAIQAEKIQVTFRAKPDEFMEAQLVDHGEGEEMDWAIIKVKDLSKTGIDICSLPFNKLGPPISDLKRGDGVSPLGNPNGHHWGMPVVPDKIDDIVGNEISFQSSFIQNGCSGGALLDHNADIIGMVTKDEPPFGVAIDINTFLAKAPIHDLYPSILIDGYELQYGFYQNVIYNPFDWAIVIGNMELVKQLLLEDDCLNINKDVINHAVYVAVAFNKMDILKMLIEKGADVNANVNESDPILSAAGRQSIDFVKILIKARANINASDEFGNSPIHSAVKNMIYGEEPEKKLAMSVIKILIDAGADVNLKNKQGDTPLHTALINDIIPAADLLRVHGAKE
jgi:ankyrin repeat protein